MKKLALALGLLLCATAHAQVTHAWTLEHHQGVSVRSAAGTCSGAGTFICDHVTLMLDGRTVVLQFTEYAGHYTQFAGTADSEDRTLIDLDGAYLDGHQAGSTGQCVLFFQSGELSQIICSALGSQLVFTVKESK
jgi:hypothetical protein